MVEGQSGVASLWMRCGVCVSVCWGGGVNKRVLCMLQVRALLRLVLALTPLLPYANVPSHLSPLTPPSLGAAAAALCGTNQPWWPPIATVIRGPSKPSFTEFATLVAKEAGIPVAKLRMAKLCVTKKVRPAPSGLCPCPSFVWSPALMKGRLAHGCSVCVGGGGL
jgi:hypothetical protein